MFKFRGGVSPERYNTSEGGRANALILRKEEVGKTSPIGGEAIG